MEASVSPESWRVVSVNSISVWCKPIPARVRVRGGITVGSVGVTEESGAV